MFFKDLLGNEEQYFFQEYSMNKNELINLDCENTDINAYPE